MATSMTPESSSVMLCRLSKRSAWRRPTYVCKGGVLRDYFRLLYSKLLSVNWGALEKHSYYTYFMLRVSRFNGLLLCFEFCCYLFSQPFDGFFLSCRQVDVYSFGVLLCEMCTRELPVPQQIQDQISLVANGVLRQLIMQCVARAPEARPTMSDVISVLTQQAESLPAEGLGQVA